MNGKVYFLIVFATSSIVASRTCILAWSRENPQGLTSSLRTIFRLQGAWACSLDFVESLGQRETVVHHFVHVHVVFTRELDFFNVGAGRVAEFGELCLDLQGLELLGRNLNNAEVRDARWS